MSWPLPSSRPQGTVLIVEDEALLRRLLARTLTEAGFDVIEAVNGRVNDLITVTVFQQRNVMRLCSRIDVPASAWHQKPG